MIYVVCEFITTKTCAYHTMYYWLLEQNYVNWIVVHKVCLHNGGWVLKKLCNSNAHVWLYEGVHYKYIKHCGSGVDKPLLPNTGIWGHSSNARGARYLTKIPSNNLNNLNWCLIYI
jgi:hypothetical protein